MSLERKSNLGPSISSPEAKKQLAESLRKMREAIEASHGKIKLPQKSKRIPLKLG